MDGGQPTGAEPCSWPRVATSRVTSRSHAGGASGRGGRPSHRCRSANRGCIVAITECACACPPRSRGASRGVRGRERGGPTRSHPEPGRDPPQRRRVLRGAPPGEARPPRAPRGAVWLLVGRGVGRRRGVEQRQLVGLITQRSEVRILPPLPSPCTHAPHSHANPPSPLPSYFRQSSIPHQFDSPLG